MSGILKRTIYMNEIPFEPGQKSGNTVKRFEDFASVITTDGVCVEPFTINDHTGLMSPQPASLDPKDMMRRIDDVQGNAHEVVRDGATVLHSYDQWVRVGP